MFLCNFNQKAMRCIIFASSPLVQDWICYAWHIISEHTIYSLIGIFLKMDYFEIEGTVFTQSNLSSAIRQTGEQTEENPQSLRRKTNVYVCTMLSGNPGLIGQQCCGIRIGDCKVSFILRAFIFTGRRCTRPRERSHLCRKISQIHQTMYCDSDLPLTRRGQRHRGVSRVGGHESRSP